MPRTTPVTVDATCASCDGTRVIPLTFGDRQTGYEQPGFKCPDCGARFQSLNNQRFPRPI
jgi:transposase-like protein